MRGVPFILKTLGWVLVLSGISGAVQLRSYTASRHDRFMGFPASPSWNESAWFGTRRFTGLGWEVDSPNKRGFALVSPLHVICATHFQPGVGQGIRFLNEDGMVVDRTVAAVVPVLNDANLATDLSVVKLDSPILAADKVAFFPLLALPTEADYQDLGLAVFGWHAKGGGGRLAAVEDGEGGGINLTRVMRFDYRLSFGGPDDCYLEVGDSGSPVFGWIDGLPVVLGTHVAIDSDASFRYNYCTFAPFYLTKLNAIMAQDGYSITTTAAQAAVLGVTLATTPGHVRQGQSATLAFQVSNPGGAAAANPVVLLRFAADRMPDTLTAPGWSIANGEPGELILTRASLAEGTSSTISAVWNDTGLITELPALLDLKADGVVARSYDFTRAVVQSYEVWSAGLAQPGMTDDPDGDGIVNLLEYAHGGDPSVASRFQPAGFPLLPVMIMAGADAELKFPVRTDAEERRLHYVIEYSGTLAAGSWTTEPPPGISVNDSPLSPAVPGFWLHTVSFPAAMERKFCRVRVELDED